MKTVTFQTLADGEAWVRANQALWRAPNLILLSGPMGAGKTQLVRWILECLGSSEAASPTYAIHHRYRLSSGMVDHLDLYRLENDADLESSGFWEILDDCNNLVLVEWADRLSDAAYPRSRPVVRIRIENQGEQRQLQVTDGSIRPEKN